MSFCNRMEGMYHPPGMVVRPDMYSAHHGPISQPAWRHNPPHPDYSLQSMGQALEAAPMHANRPNTCSAPSSARSTSRNNKSVRKVSTDELPAGKVVEGSQGKRVARVFPRRKAGEEKRSTDTPVILTKEMLLPLFAIPLRDAAEMMGLCPTALKSVCRRLGIERWPFQQRRGGNAAARATKNKEAKAHAQQIMNPQASNDLAFSATLQSSSSSPTSSEHSDAPTTCSAAPTESVEHAEVEQEFKSVPHYINTVTTTIKHAASPWQQNHHSPELAVQHIKHEHSTENLASDAEPSEPVRFEAVAHGHFVPVCDLTQPHNIAQQSHHQPASDEWVAALEQKSSNDLFPSLFGYVPWGESRGDEASSCDMSFLTVRI